MNDLSPKRPALFHLQRDADESGVSGTGRVADGVEFQDGTVVLRWLGSRASTVVYASIADVEAVHGHGGKTRLVFDHGSREYFPGRAGPLDVVIFDALGRELDRRSVETPFSLAIVDERQG